jgi:hypothetical protein
VPPPWSPFWLLFGFVSVSLSSPAKKRKYAPTPSPARTTMPMITQRTALEPPGFCGPPGGP